MRGWTYAEIIAGTRPNRASVNPNQAPRTATAMSTQPRRPAAPPSACPFTRAIVGAGKSCTARSMPSNRRESATFSSNE
jgi:hypothetical protein